MTKRHRSPFGFLVWSLVKCRESAAAMLDRLFADSPALRTQLTRVLRHGSLVDGSIHGPLMFSDGTSYRAPSIDAALDVSRPLYSLCAARMLGSFLLYAERVDPITRKGSGRMLWQGHHARRLGLSTRTREPGAPQSGTREVQRYARLLAGGGVIELHQPNAANVPDTMRGAEKPHGDQWAYNVVRLATPLPVELRNMLARWRGLPAVVPLPKVARAIEGEPVPPGELAALLAALLARPPREHA